MTTRRRTSDRQEGRESRVWTGDQGAQGERGEGGDGGLQQRRRQGEQMKRASA